MPSSKITNLIYINGFHDFYESGTMRDWQFSLTSKSKVSMRKAGLFFKQDAAKVIIGCQLDKLQSYLVTSNLPFDIRLKITIKNTLFQNFTDLPLFSPIEKKLYFKNWTSNSAEQHSAERQIVIKENASFLHETERVNKDTLKAIEDLPADLTGTHIASTIGIVDLKINQEMVEQAIAKPIPLDYKIHFAARKLTWRYFLANIDTERFATVNILKNDAIEPKVIASTYKEHQLSNGTIAQRYDLVEPLYIKDYYPSHFEAELVRHGIKGSKLDGGSSTDTPLGNNNTFKQFKANNPKIKLPNPTEEFVRGEKLENGEIKFFGDMYVYI